MLLILDCIIDCIIDFRHGQEYPIFIVTIKHAWYFKDIIRHIYEYIATVYTVSLITELEYAKEPSCLVLSFFLTELNHCNKGNIQFGVIPDFTFSGRERWQSSDRNPYRWFGFWHWKMTAINIWYFRIFLSAAWSLRWYRILNIAQPARSCLDSSAVPPKKFI